MSSETHRLWSRYLVGAVEIAMLPPHLHGKTTAQTKEERGYKSSLVAAPQQVDMQALEHAGVPGEPALLMPTKVKVAPFPP